MIHRIKRYFYFTGEFFCSDKVFPNFTTRYHQSPDLTNFRLVPEIPVQNKKTNRKNYFCWFFFAR